jgi:mannose-6-phosphate isomerase-like protein (cupin superfamily)
MNTLIETYYTSEQGYHPFLITKDWQVAQLNFMPEQSFFNIVKLDKHEQTDEVFVLTKGVAVLISATISGEQISFNCVKMQPGVIYNIPANTWHNIAMDKSAQVIIAEKSNTHLGDFIYHPLSSIQILELKNHINYCLQENH